ncbi:unnamed protein product [Dicrocoelium dendriticum]|nr:unnamed protein product [Dicrocoelium dendriticum]
MRRRQRSEETDGQTKPPLSQLTTDNAIRGKISVAHGSSDSLAKSSKKFTSKATRRTSKLTKRFTGLTSLFKRNKPVQLPSFLSGIAKMRCELIRELEHASTLLSSTSSRPDAVSQLKQSVWLIRCIVASGAAFLQPIVQVPKSSDDPLRPVLAMKNQRILEKLFHFHDSYIEFLDWASQFSSSNGELPSEMPCSSGLTSTGDAQASSESAANPLAWLRGQSVFGDLKASSMAIFDLLDSFGFTKPIDPLLLEQAVQKRPSCSSESAVERTATTPESEDASSEHFLTDADCALLAKLWTHLSELNSTSSSREPLLKQSVPQPTELSPSVVRESPTHDTKASGLVPPTACRPHSLLDDPDLPGYLNALARAVQSDHLSSNSRRSSTISFAATDPRLAPSEIDVNSPDQLNFPAADASDVDVDDEEEVPVDVPAINVKFPLDHTDHCVLLSTDAGAGSPLTCTIGDDSDRFVSPKSSPAPVTTCVSTRTEFKILHSGEVAWDHAKNINAYTPLDDRHMLQDIATVAMHLQDDRPTSTSPKLSNPLPSTTEPLLSTCTTPLSFHFPDGQLSHAASSQPTYHAEVKVGTIDDSELIDVDGKKFRRHFQRHIQIERHKMRQIVVAPSLPDGTGPDLSRVVQRDVGYDTLSPSLGISNAGGKPLQSFDSDLSDSDCDAELETSDLPHAEGESKDEELVHTSDSDVDNRQETEKEPPPKPSLPDVVSLRGGKRPLSNYMFRFGSTLYNDADVDANLPDRLLSFFRDGWHKSESAEGPHARSKVMSYVQSYEQPTTTGEVIRRSTCVEHKCTVRIVGGLEGLKSQLEHANYTNQNSRSSVGSICIEDSPLPPSSLTGPLFTSEPTEESPLLQHSLSTPSCAELVGSFPPCRSILSLVKADDYLVWADSSSSGEVVVQAGIIDAFVVYLTSFGKTSPSFYLFFETFLAMYPSFLSTESLLDRLLLRYRCFRADGGEQQLTDADRQLHTKVCNATASIVVTVVSRLKSPLTSGLQQTLLEFQEMLLADNLSSLSRVLTTTVQQHLSLTQQAEHHHHPYCPNVSRSSSELSEQPDECRKLPSGTSEESTVVSDHSEETSDDLSPRPTVSGANTVPKTKHHFLRRTSGAKGRESSFERSSVESVLKGSHLSPRAERAGNPTASTSGKSLLNFSARELAEQFTFLDAQKYYRIRHALTDDVISECATVFWRLSSRNCGCRPSTPSPECVGDTLAGPVRVGRVGKKFVSRLHTSCTLPTHFVPQASFFFSNCETSPLNRPSNQADRIDWAEQGALALRELESTTWSPFIDLHGHVNGTFDPGVHRGTQLNERPPRPSRLSHKTSLRNKLPNSAVRSSDQSMAPESRGPCVVAATRTPTSSHQPDLVGRRPRTPTLGRAALFVRASQSNWERNEQKTGLSQSSNYYAKFPDTAHFQTGVENEVVSLQNCLSRSSSVNCELRNYTISRDGSSLSSSSTLTRPSDSRPPCTTPVSPQVDQCARTHLPRRCVYHAYDTVPFDHFEMEKLAPNIKMFSQNCSPVVSVDCVKASCSHMSSGCFVPSPKDPMQQSTFGNDLWSSGCISESTSSSCSESGISAHSTQDAATGSPTRNVRQHTESRLRRTSGVVLPLCQETQWPLPKAAAHSRLPIPSKRVANQIGDGHGAGKPPEAYNHLNMVKKSGSVSGRHVPKDGVAKVNRDELSHSKATGFQKSLHNGYLNNYTASVHTNRIARAGNSTHQSKSAPETTVVPVGSIKDVQKYVPLCEDSRSRIGTRVFSGKFLVQLFYIRTGGGKVVDIRSCAPCRASITGGSCS